MTEQMAQKWLEQFEFPTDESSCDALATICEALQEYPKYRAIGTIAELQALKEKSVAKKPLLVPSEHTLLRQEYSCPSCGGYLSSVARRIRCECNQLLDWE